MLLINLILTIKVIIVMKRETIKKILKLIAYIATALAGAFGGSQLM